MKKLLLLLFVAVVATGFSVNSFAQSKEKPANKKSNKEMHKVEKTEQSSQMKETMGAADAKPVNTVCPVSMEEPDPQITYSYKGKTYQLCCKKCLRKFKADPEKYIKRLNEQQAEPQEEKSSGKDK